mgnify:CR=1 FL=1
MKKVILILSLCLLFSCKEIPQEQEIYCKYKRGELVYIDNEAFQISEIPYEEGGKYMVDKLDCRSDNWSACRFWFLESEISKYKN